MTQNIKVGLSLLKNYVIKSEHAAKSVGSGEVEVLSTPSMIAFMEKTARDCVQPKLAEGFITVGTRVDIRHLGPVPIGENLAVSVELKEINDRRLLFEVKAEWLNQSIGIGQHERYIVNKKKFLQKLKQKIC